MKHVTSHRPPYIRTSFGVCSICIEIIRFKMHNHPNGHKHLETIGVSALCLSPHYYRRWPATRIYETEIEHLMNTFLSEGLVRRKSHALFEACNSNKCSPAVLNLWILARRFFVFLAMLTNVRYLSNHICRFIASDHFERPVPSSTHRSLCALPAAETWVHGRCVICTV